MGFEVGLSALFLACASLISSSGLASSLAFGTLSTQSSFALDRPVHAAIPILASLGAAVLGLDRALNRFAAGANVSQKYAAVPLDDLERSQEASEPAPTPDVVHHSPSQRKTRLLIAGLVVLLCLKVEITRRILRDVQCSGFGFSALVPLLLAVVDFVMVRRHERHPLDDAEGSSLYDVVERRVMRSLYRYLIPTAMLSFSGVALSRTGIGPASTYICPAISSSRTWIPILQHLELPLDFCIAICVDLLINITPPGFGVKRHSDVGWVFLISAFLVGIAGFLYYTLVPDDRLWISKIPPGFVWSLVRLDIFACFIAVSALLAVSSAGIMTATVVATFTISCVKATQWAWNNVHSFPPLSSGWSFSSYCLLLLSLAAYFNVPQAYEIRQSRHRSTAGRASASLYLVLLTLFTLRTSLWFSSSTHANYHPIDMLMYQAKIQHKDYLKEASASANLTAAVSNYHARYQRAPPPGFSKWYDYASSRNAVIIDDFDGLNNDMLPFWSLSPAEIRQRAWEVISNPWNDVAGISIRNGKAEISPNVVPTHRWMLDGIIGIMDKFGQELPDMDLGFNLNDECRIAVPFEDIEPMREVGRRSGNTGSTLRDGFSSDRGRQWLPIPEEPNPDRPFREMSFQRTFYDFGSLGCSPGSPARTQRHWDVSHLCTTCSDRHSLGGFLANWTMSADICYQPDMANLHGFYLSPAAFKASPKLYPVFSQSKVHGYNDILYPSAWNYMDKAKYDPNEENPDPEFAHKKNTLFWRGATSEGVSPGSGTWKGMTRQRFIHLANNINNTMPPQPVLLPYPIAPSRGKLTYDMVDATELTPHLSTDVHVVDFIARCGGKDCDDQAQEFAPLVKPSEFQSHWSYKYLLDLDGAGFSGRFLPFLSSRSLPFKAALFREWYDSRLTPWLHFVPLDSRGHGLWSTLMYFMGFEGKIKGQMVISPNHEKEAALIAEEGREWSGKVLRKEDMEIYFYRLLLEWGRLTDDKRDELGFTLT